MQNEIANSLISAIGRKKDSIILEALQCGGIIDLKKVKVIKDPANFLETVSYDGLDLLEFYPMQIDYEKQTVKAELQYRVINKLEARNVKRS